MWVFGARGGARRDRQRRHGTDHRDNPGVLLATKRLRLGPLQADDLQAFVAYRSHPDVARYQSWDPTYAMSDAEALLAAQADIAFGTPGAWVQVAALDLPRRSQKPRG